MDRNANKVYQVEFALRDILDVCSEGDNTYRGIAGMQLTMPVEYKFGEFDHIQRYANAVIRDYNGRHDTQHKKVRVVEGRKSLHKKAYYTHGMGRITLPQRDSGSWAWRQTVVLHEIAHHLAPCPGHGVEFAEVMLDLLENYVGLQAGLVYVILLDKEGITIGRKQYV